MRKYATLITFLALAAVQPVCARRTVDTCPDLPTSSDITWDFESGSDFVVCHAVRAEKKQQLFGLYLGNYPGFHPDPKQRVTAGAIGGIPVIWYRQRSEDQRDSLQAVVVVPGGRPDLPLEALVWVGSLSRNDRILAFTTIAKLRFKDNWYRRP